MASAIDYPNWKEEKIDGEIYYMSPSANPKHSKVIFNIAMFFKIYLKGKTCEVFMDNIDIFLDEEQNHYVIPDMSILCDPNKFKDDCYHGVPSLVVEVISPTSVKRDRKDKYSLYERFGVKEFWLVDYQNKTIEQYILDNSKYTLYNLCSLISEWDYNNRLNDNLTNAHNF